MKIIQLDLVLTHSPKQNLISQVKLFSIFYFKSVKCNFKILFLAVTYLYFGEHGSFEHYFIKD